MAIFWLIVFIVLVHWDVFATVFSRKDEVDWSLPVMWTHEEVDYNEFYPHDRNHEIQKNRSTISNMKKRSRRAVTAVKELLWPNATVPYLMVANLSDRTRNNIAFAIAHWENLTCIRFVQRSTEVDYIKFTSGECGCCSFVGCLRIGVQLVNLSPHCAVEGVVIHELGHVIGFWHEHSRPDRDKYIKIVINNVKTGKKDNFGRKTRTEIDSFGQPYDYSSIMHYKDSTFSRNGKKTMQALKSGVMIGQRIGLSKGDVIQANLLYNCPMCLLGKCLNADVAFIISFNEMQMRAKIKDQRAVCVHIEPNCSGVFEESVGNFSSPNYPMNYYREHGCTWVIKVPKDHSVHLTFDDFDVERSINCTYDYVEIRQGSQGDGPLIGRLCGMGKPGDVKSVGDVWIRFQADASVERRGFRCHYEISGIYDIYEQTTGMMSDDVCGSGGSGAVVEDKPFLYRTDCQHDIVNRSRGIIMSPLIMALYSKAVDCRWTLKGGTNALAIQIMLDIEFTNPGSCFADIYVKPRKIKWNLTRSDLQVKKLLPSNKETNMYEKYVYDCNKAQIILNSNEVMIKWSSVFHDEFRIHYVIDYDECQLNSSVCEHKCSNTIGSYRCHCKAGYLVDSKDRSQCLPKKIEFSDKCGWRFSSVRGKLRSSTEPEKYCIYEIKQSINFRITIAFFKFMVPSSINCSNGYIEVFGRNNQSLKGKFCGNKHPNVLTTPNGYVKIIAYTNLANQTILPFFTASYIAHMSQKDRCFHRFRGHGKFASPGFPNNYIHDNMCIWKISAHGKNRLKLIFHSMELEETQNCGFDYVEVRDGRHRNSQLIGKYCGKTPPRPIISSGRHLWVMFASDGTHSGKGFNATFGTYKTDEQPVTEEDHDYNKIIDKQEINLSAGVNRQILMTKNKISKSKKNSVITSKTDIFSKTLDSNRSKEKNKVVNKHKISKMLDVTASSKRAKVPVIDQEIDENDVDNRQEEDNIFVNVSEKDLDNHSNF